MKPETACPASTHLLANCWRKTAGFFAPRSLNHERILNQFPHPKNWACVCQLLLFPEHVQSLQHRIVDRLLCKIPSTPLGGSWVVIIGVLYPSIRVKTILLLPTHESPSKPFLQLASGCLPLYAHALHPQTLKPPHS